MSGCGGTTGDGLFDPFVADAGADAEPEEASPVGSSEDGPVAKDAVGSDTSTPPDSRVVDAGRIDSPLDSTNEARIDVVVDVRVHDTRGDTSSDAASDASHDLAPDGGVDASPDRTIDALADRASDAPADRQLEGGADGQPCVAGPDICDGLDNNCNGAIDEGGACPNGCVGLARAGAGYMFCYGDPVHRSWPAAQADCVLHGMHLVRVDDAAENAWINSAAVNLAFLEQIWIGAAFFPSDGVWRWTDGTAFWSGGASGMPVNGLFSNWRAGIEPQNFVGEDNCADKRFGNTTVWENLSCARLFGYMCER